MGWRDEKKTASHLLVLGLNELDERPFCWVIACLYWQGKEMMPRIPVSRISGLLTCSSQEGDLCCRAHLVG